MELAQKEQKTGDNSDGNEINWELCKYLKLDHTIKSFFN